MKIIHIILPLLGILLGTAGCNEERDQSPFIDTSEDAFHYTDKGGCDTVVVSSNVDWTLTGCTDGVSVTPGYGDAGKQVYVRITCAPNAGAAVNLGLMLTADDGCVSKQINVTQDMCDFSVTTDAPFSIRSKKVAITGQFSYSENPVTEVGIDFCTAGGPWVRAKASVVESPFTVEISGLSEKTEYSYYAYAIVNGIEEKGETKDFTTTAANMVNVPVHSAVGIRKATLNASFLSDEAPSAAGFGYGAMDGSEEVHFKKVSCAVQDNLEVSLDDLDTLTTYLCYAFIVSGGETVRSDYDTLKTGTLNVLYGMSFANNSANVKAQSSTGVFYSLKNPGNMTDGKYEYNSSDAGTYADFRWIGSKTDAQNYSARPHYGPNGDQVSEGGYLCFIKYALEEPTVVSGGALFNSIGPKLDIDGFDILTSADGSNWSIAYSGSSLASGCKYEPYSNTTNRISFDFAPVKAKYVMFAMTSPRCQTADQNQLDAYTSKYLAPFGLSAAAINLDANYFRIAELEIYRVE